MKIKVQCPECASKALFDNNYNLNLSLNDQEIKRSYFEFDCPKGHHVKKFMATPQYELLYDVGISALNDGYYREAALDFAACLERFYESCILSIWFKLNPNIFAYMREPWKEMSRQSERQYGAFVALYFAIHGECPPKPIPKMVEFRNNVTHKGHFPTKEETMEYANYVASHIQSIYWEIRKLGVPFVGQHYDGLMSIWPIQGDMDGHSIVTMLSLMINWGQSWDEALEAYNASFDYYYSK